MTRIQNLKGLLTKSWNSGNYSTYEDFCVFFKKTFIPKYHVCGYEYVELIDHFAKITQNPPKIKQKIKHHYNEWYVYFYYIDEDWSHPIYIGKTYDIENRLNQHIKENEKYKNVKHILYCKFKTEQDALDFEAYYTRYLQPKWNISNKSTPSQIYKLPTQKIHYWIPITRFNKNDSIEQQLLKARSDKEKFEYGKNNIEPKLQKIIDSISIINT